MITLEEAQERVFNLNKRLDYFEGIDTTFYGEDEEYYFIPIRRSPEIAQIPGGGAIHMVNKTTGKVWVDIYRPDTPTTDRLEQMTIVHLN